jgi:hypothetical protein
LDNAENDLKKMGVRGWRKDLETEKVETDSEGGPGLAWTIKEVRRRD